MTNAAGASALNDTLQATLGGAPAGFTTSGSVTGLAAGATDAGSLRVGLNTATAGVFAGSANVAFASHDGELADLALGGATVALHGQVNNFAEASLTKTGAGTLTRTGNTYTLDFGTLALGAGEQSASLAVLNSAIGPADLLSGAFDLGGVGPGLTLAGFGSFANLVAGASFGGLDVVFDDDDAGAFLATLVLHATGSNASGFEGRLDDITLVIRGDVAIAAVPEPETYALMIGGLWSSRASRDGAANGATRRVCSGAEPALPALPRTRGNADCALNDRPTTAIDLCRSMCAPRRPKVETMQARRRPCASALLPLFVAIAAGGAGAAGSASPRELDAPTRDKSRARAPTAYERETPVARPVLDRSGKKRVGIASVYSYWFVGRKMADGTRMDAHDDNAASKTLPLGTQAKVTNLKTRQSATVTIQDRGPYVKGRIVDLSPATAAADRHHAEGRHRQGRGQADQPAAAGGRGEELIRSGGVAPLHSTARARPSRSSRPATL